MLTKSQYKEHILSNKNYPVIFGVTYKMDADEPYKTISKMGRRKHTHNDIRIVAPMYAESAFSWRYVPLVNVVYWWDEPNDIVIEDVLNHLKKKYNESPIKHVRLYQWGEKKADSSANLAAKMSSHALDYASADAEKLPSFAQWLKTHRSGD